MRINEIGGVNMTKTKQYVESIPVKVCPLANVHIKSIVIIKKPHKRPTKKSIAVMIVAILSNII